MCKFVYIYARRVKNQIGNIFNVINIFNAIKKLVYIRKMNISFILISFILYRKNNMHKNIL